MKILLKEQIDNYRFAVAKVIFLLVENRYEFITDIRESNLMIVSDKIKKQDIYVSILGKPTPKIPEKSSVLIFYQKASYGRYKDNESIRQKKLLLSEAFDKLFAEAIEIAFTDVLLFLEKFQFAHYDIIEYYFLEAEKKILNDLEKAKAYKYFSKDTVSRNNHLVNDGRLSFSHPKFFNDPFDCNCSLSNNIDMSEKFRVLCLTHQHDNILMWSYYSQSHQGYCFQLSYQNLIDEIKRIDVSGLCIYGKLNYNQKRPAQKSKVNYFSFTDLKFYIDAIFTKYLEWKHEKEYRFVIISQQLTNDFVPVQVSIEKIYEGCLGDGNSVYNSGKEMLKTTKLSKDDIEYKLND